MKTNYYRDVERIFDLASSAYDQDEAENLIRRMMRVHSLRVLKATFRAGQKVLEIGCGTGTEAIELAKSNITVVATDISPQMIARLNRRAQIEKVANRVRAHHCAAHDVDKLQRTYGQGSFDGAYSSFGALNCEPKLKQFSSSLAGLLKPHSRFVCSIINRFCLFDLALNALIFKRTNRLDKRVSLSVGNYKLIATFYSFGEFKSVFRDFFTVEHVRGLPAILPPPHFNKHMRSIRSAMKWASKVDWGVGKFFPFNRIGDHFLVVFRKQE